MGGSGRQPGCFPSSEGQRAFLEMRSTASAQDFHSKLSLKVSHRLSRLQSLALPFCLGGLLALRLRQLLAAQPKAAAAAAGAPGEGCQELLLAFFALLARAGAKRELSSSCALLALLACLAGAPALQPLGAGKA